MPIRDETDWVKYLDGQLALHRPGLERLDRYYEGQQPLRYMAPVIQEELGDRVTQLVLNWCRLGADAYENRLDVEGFRLPGSDEADADLWRIWQENDLDEVSQQAHLEAIALSRSYVIVGPNPDAKDSPLITVEHPLQVITELNPRTRQVEWGLKRWKDLDDTERATLYGINEDRFYRLFKGKWIEDERERNEHRRGIASVVPIVNRGRMLRPLGTSEFVDIIPVADAANKMATDMMISGEFHAMPRRVWFGLEESDFVDDSGNPVSPLSRLAGREWAIPEKKGEQVDVEQFRETDLTVFHNSIRLLAQLAGQLMALPPHYMGFGTDNPPSADAIRSAEAQLVKKVERKQRIFGGSWELVMRLARWHATDADAPELRRLETIWRDASTPTVAQKADAAVKLRTAGISTVRQAREDVGYTQTQISRMETDDEAAARRDPTAQIARDFAGVTGDSASSGPGETVPATGVDSGSEG